MVAMSGGVDSSVTAALVQQQGHEVVGVTLKLWGGESDQGCCSVSDVDDARRVADQLGIDHHVFNFGDEFSEHVVDPYVADHAAGRTPNPCIECNRHLKFDRLLRRADALGFDAVATGHHARVVDHDGVLRVGRGTDPTKDQSYVVHMLRPDQLARVRFPVGDRTKSDVRELAETLGLRTASKPDSQDVCFITAGQGRQNFLADRLDLHHGDVIDEAGTVVGHTDAVELVTLGQRRGLGLGGGGVPRYVTNVDVPRRRVQVGRRHDLLVDSVSVGDLIWLAGRVDGPLSVQASAHGQARAASVDGTVVRFAEPVPRVASGQSVVVYAGDLVVAGGIAD